MFGVARIERLLTEILIELRARNIHTHLSANVYTRAVRDVGMMSGGRVDLPSGAERAPFQPSDIIVTDPQEQWKREQLRALGDDTELMQAFAQEHGLLAYEKVREGAGPARELFEAFRAEREAADEVK